MDIRRLYPLFVLLAVANPHGGCDCGDGQDGSNDGAQEGSGRSDGCGGGDSSPPDDSISDDSVSDDSNDTEPPVDEDGDGSKSDVDCDDTDESAYPGATEICDGVDNNCDSTVDEAQLACFTTADDFYDYSTVLNAATAEAPATIKLKGDGRLELGEGQWYGGFEIDGDVNISGAGVGKTVLMGAGIIPLLNIKDNVSNGYVVNVAGVSLVEGQATQTVSGRLVGGAVSCASTAVEDESAGTARTVVSFTDVVLRDSSADRGGGLYSGGCTVNLTNVEISGNTAGSTGSGGGVYTEGNSPITMLDSKIVDNSARSGGNLFINSPVVCDVASDSTAGVRGGAATLDGGGLFLSNGSIDSNGCDWGSGADDNLLNGSPQDIAIDSLPSFNATTESFYCDAGNACTLDE